MKFKGFFEQITPNLEILRKLKKETKNKIKFLQVSTDEVYGDILGNRLASEKDNYNPSSPYSASKASADQLVKAYSRTYGIKTLIVNPCNNYGPNQFPEKLIPTLIFNILNNNQYRIMNTFSQVKSDHVQSG